MNNRNKQLPNDVKCSQSDFVIQTDNLDHAKEQVTHIIELIRKDYNNGEIVMDTETTGFDPETGDRIVEIGGVELFNHVPTEMYITNISTQNEACHKRRLRFTVWVMISCVISQFFQKLHKIF